MTSPTTKEPSKPAASFSRAATRAVLPGAAGQLLVRAILRRLALVLAVGVPVAAGAVGVVAWRASASSAAPSTARSDHRPAQAHLAPAAFQDASDEDVLREANEQRRLGHWREAADLYEKAARAFEGSARRLLVVARLAEGALRLDHLDDPRGAAVGYKLALRDARKGSPDLGSDAAQGLERARVTLATTPRRAP